MVCRNSNAAASFSSAGQGAPPGRRAVKSGGAQARSIVKRLLAGVPSGSYLVVNDGTHTSEEIVEGARVSGEGGHSYTLRSPEEIARFFDGLDLLEPGVVAAPRWRPELGPSGLPAEIDSRCGVARKP